MMRKSIVLLSAALLSLFIGACAGAPPKQEAPPVMMPCEFVESVDADIDLVKCQGKGGDQPAAVRHARMSILEWAITDKLALTPGEKQNYENQKNTVMAKLDKYVEMPPPGSRDGKGAGIKSQVRISDSEIQVTVITKAHVKQLKDDLVALGIAASKDEMLAGVGNPTMMTVPFPQSSGNKFRGMLEGILNSYLTKNKFEVISSSGQADVEKMKEAFMNAAGGEQDDAAAVARAIGADVFIKFEAMKDTPAGGGEEVAYSVRLEAYETTTARMLASEKKTGPARVTWRAGEEQRAVEEAARDAMASVVNQVISYWKEDAPKGNKFFVVFQNPPKGTDVKMSRTLKNANCSEVKLVSSVAKEVKFLVRCKGDNLEIAGAIDEGITNAMAGANYDFAAKNRNSVLVIFR